GPSRSPSRPPGPAPWRRAPGRASRGPSGRIPASSASRDLPRENYPTGSTRPKAELCGPPGQLHTGECIAMNDVQLEFFGRLCAAFEPEQIRSYSASGRTFHYITSRSIMNRLDDACGVTGWYPEYHVHPNGV